MLGFVSVIGTLRADLVGYWTFDNESYNDASGLNNHAQAGPTTQAPLFSTDVPLTLSGRANARSLDLRNRTTPTAGTDCYAFVPGSGSLYNFTPPSGQQQKFTISVWVKGWPSDAWVPFISKNGEPNGWQIRRNGNGNDADFTTRGGSTGFGQNNGDFSTGQNQLPNSGNVNPGARNPTQWMHYVCTFDGTTKRIYLNSQLINEQANPGATLQASTNLLVFGARDNGGIGAYTRLQLDDVALWDQTLTPLEVADLYAGTDARYVHNTITPYNVGEPWGTPGFIGMREARNPSPGTAGINNLNTLLGTQSNGTAVFTSSSFSQLYFKDPENAGGGGSATQSFLSVIPGSEDDQFALVANAGLNVPTAGFYSFLFSGDDGFQAGISGTPWTKINSSNGNASFSGEMLVNMPATADTATLAVIYLTAGVHNFRYAWFEAGGGAYCRVRVAPGDKSGLDGDFKTLGDPTSPITLVDQKPVLHAFTTNTAGVLTTGGANPVPANITLSWDSTYTTSLAISPTPPGNPTLPLSGSLTIPSPTTTTTYTLTGTTGAQTTTRSVTIFADQAPTIHSFTIADSTLVAGAPLTLNWNVLAAATLSIDNGVGNVSPTSTGSITIPAPADDTTYILTATNPNGSVTASISVDIGLPPVIQSFTALDTSIMPLGSADLSWVITNSTSQNLSPRPGAVPATGSLSERLRSATTYTLTGTNVYASVSQNLAIAVPQALFITPAGWSYTRVSATSATVNSLQVADGLLDGSVPGTTFGPVTGLTQINFGDGSVGVFPGGEILPVGGNGNDFVVRCTATIHVNLPGFYSFGINNDDGGRLRIDGADVVIDDALHAPLTSLDSVQLTAGPHTIEYVFFEQGGGFAGEVFWVQPDNSTALLAASNGYITPSTSTLVINEFQAINSNTLLDADEQATDWIELYNGTAAPIDLAGHYLSNDALMPNKWTFPTGPSYIIQPGEYLVVFASGKNTTFLGNQFHTNFTLANTGYLSLKKDDGMGGYTTLTEFNPYPLQRQDRSYGRYDTEQFLGFFTVPTPGSGNVGGFEGFVPDVVFSEQRGVKTASFALTLTTTEPTAVIRYTLDGATPTETTGSIYSAPINISATTVVRAAAFKPYWVTSPVETHSYVFTADVAVQTAATATAKGFPLGPIKGQLLDYAMDSRITGPDAAAVQTALNAIPSIAITTDLDNLFDPNYGIYVSANERGENWERPASFEILNDSAAADNTTGSVHKQIDCGVRIRGGFSRAADNPKHAFRLYFKRRYEGDLNYSLFGASGASSYENIDIQCPQNYSWSFAPDTSPGNAAYQANTFMRELFARDTQRDMGQPSTRSRYYHLYINGIYWGIFTSQERANASYGDSYLGGDEDNYDVIKSAASSGGYNTEATDGFVTQGTSTTPGSAWARLWFNVRDLRTVDTTESQRTTRYFALQGLGADGVTVLPAATAPRLLDPSNLADYMITTFYCGSFDAPLSTFVGASNNWFGLRERTTNKGFAFMAHDFEHSMGAEGETTNARSTDRTGPYGGPGTNYKGETMIGTIDQYLKSNPQYLNEDLAFSAEYRMKFADRVHRALFNGGPLTQTAVLARLNARATVLDPIIIAESARWGDSKQADPFTKNNWLQAKDRLFNWIDKGSNELVASNTATGRAAVLIAQLRAYKDKATGSSSGAGDSELVSMPLYPLIDAPIFSQNGGVLGAGTFTITNPNTGGDTGTILYRTDGLDPREIGGSVRSGNLTLASGGTVTLPGSRRVLARVYRSSTQEWSALNDFEFLVGVPASSSNLLITEINYNPVAGAPGTATDRQMYEFIELWNPTGDLVQLDGVAFTLGITFDFATSSISSIPPGGRILLIKDTTAFAQRYPASLYPQQIAGLFTGSLDNGGERLTLRNNITNTEIANFVYDDDPLTGWPTSPDGNGSTLCLTNTNPVSANKDLAASWFAHGLPRGFPGTADLPLYDYTAYAAALGLQNPGDDNDGDGVVNLLEYALLTNSNSSASLQKPVGGTQSVSGTDYLTLTFTRRIGAPDITYLVQTSDDLGTWTANAVLVQTTVVNPGISETVTFRCPAPLTGDDKHFIRLRVQMNP